MIVYRASELGACTKYLVASQCGFDPPPNYGEDIDAFKQGHKIEKEVLEWLPTQGYTITTTQKEMYLPMGANEEGEPIVIQCHADAIGYDKTGRETVIEIKSAADSSYKDFLKNGWERAGGLFPRYLYQVSAYHHATNKLPVTFIVRNKEFDNEGVPIARSRKPGRTLISVESASPPLYTLEQLRARVMRVERLARAYDIPDACDYPNFYCPLSYLHEEKREFVTNDAIDDLAREYDELRYAIKTAKDKEGAKRLNIRNKLLKEMGLDPWEKVGGSTTRLQTQNAKVTAIWGITGYANYDAELMRADGIDPEKYRKPPKMGWRVNVWVRDGHIQKGRKKKVESEKGVVE